MIGTGSGPDLWAGAGSELNLWAGAGSGLDLWAGTGSGQGLGAGVDLSTSGRADSLYATQTYQMATAITGSAAVGSETSRSTGPRTTKI